MEPWEHLTYVHDRAVETFLEQVVAAGVWFELRQHEVPRHARHLASLWNVPLHQAGRATLFSAEDSTAMLAVVPADRKVSAPRLRELLSVETLRVLRGDRGVGRVGWRGLPGDPAALPAVPALFGATGIVDERVLIAPHTVVSIGGERSLAIRPRDYVDLTGALVERFSGSTRLLEEGGMVDEP